MPNENNGQRLLILTTSKRISFCISKQEVIEFQLSQIKSVISHRCSHFRFRNVEYESLSSFLQPDRQHHPEPAEGQQDQSCQNAEDHRRSCRVGGPSCKVMIFWIY